MKKKKYEKKGKKNPTIYHTQEGHANNYTTDDVLHGKCWFVFYIKILFDWLVYGV